MSRNSVATCEEAYQTAPVIWWSLTCQWCGHDLVNQLSVAIDGQVLLALIQAQCHVSLVLWFQFAEVDPIHTDIIVIITVANMIFPKGLLYA